MGVQGEIWNTVYLKISTWYFVFMHYLPYAMTDDGRFLNFVFKTNRYNPTFSITTKGCNNNSLAKNNSEQTVTAPNI